jgi:hypothetical protein
MLGYGGSGMDEPRKKKERKGTGKATDVLALLLYFNQEISLRVSLNLLVLIISN